MTRAATSLQSLLRSSGRIARRLWLLPVRFYQRAISPLTPPSCRFTPSCSSYAIEAVETRGIVYGSLLSGWRILRCNPFCAGGHDPVPLVGGPTRSQLGSKEVS